MTATILVVDDIEANLKVLEAKLSTHYYSVITTNQGKKALEILKKKRIDIILSDVLMPEMDGFALCEAIKKNHETTFIPIIMITALSDIEDKIRGLSVGADDFLSKPINDTELFIRIKSLYKLKQLTDELKVRNQVNLQLGADQVAISEDFNNKKILIIDDDIVSCRFIMNTTKKLSCNVKTVNDIGDIESIYESFEPEIVMISCQLMNDDPLKVFTRLNTIDISEKPYFILIAEEDKLDTVMKGIEIGISDYIIYPINESELIARSKNQLKRKMYHNLLKNQIIESIDLSVKDTLTNVYNRRYFEIHATKMIALTNSANKKLFFFMLDIDKFKYINDNHGHQIGDMVIKEVSQIIKQNIRVTDLVARYGGDEFIIMLVDIPNAKVLTIAQRIRSSIEEKKFTTPEGKTFNTNISIGIAESYNDSTLETLIKKADQALYKSKNLGRNTVSFYDDSMGK